MGGIIVIEGLDGSGKSTQIARLHEWLVARGKPCRLLHFPRTDSPIYGELIARFLRGELGNIGHVNPYLVALMYAGDRFDCKPILRQWIDAGEMVLLDRYVYSNVAYQCAKLHEAAEKEALRRWILQLEFDYHGLPKPDVNVYLDVPAEFTSRNLTASRQGGDRDYLKGEKDIHEADMDFQQEVRSGYLSLAAEPNFVKIDCGSAAGMLSVDDIFDKIIQELSKKIKF